MEILSVTAILRQTDAGFGREEYFFGNAESGSFSPPG
jgi:hypothetical protein